MATSLTDLRTSLNRRVAGLTKHVSNEILGSGDGSKTIFYVKLPPIDSDTLTVYVNSVENTDITVDETYGRITFDSAVANGSVVSADYIGYAFYNDDLDSIITEAVEDLRQRYTTKSFSIVASNVSPTPSTVEERLIVQQCVLNMIDNLMISLTMDAIRTAQTGFSFDTTARSDNMIKIRDRLKADLDKAIAELNMSQLYTNDPDLII